MKRTQDIPWQRYLEDKRKCTNVQSAAPIIQPKTPSALSQSSTSVVAKVSVLLEKQAVAHPRSMFCALVIVVGLVMYMLNSMAMNTKIASVMDFINFIAILLLGMVIYKKVHNKKVTW